MEENEPRFEVTFEKLLSTMGKEDWLPSQIRRVASISTGKTFYTAAEKHDMFKKWKHFSEESMMNEAGLGKKIRNPVSVGNSFESPL